MQLKDGFAHIPRSVGLVAIAVAFGVLCLGFGAWSYVTGSTAFQESESYAQKMHVCERASAQFAGLTAGRADVDSQETITRHCFNDILFADKLAESSITRGMYIHQRYENNVILFMVVLITLAGVGLAGLQLMTSYKLAQGGHVMAAAASQTAAVAASDAASAPPSPGAGAAGPMSGDVSEVWLEQGRITIRSSVTGLIVLALSLAFFFIYVAMVYTIRVPQDPTSEDSSTAAVSSVPATPALPAAPILMGGNGPTP